MEHVQFNFFFNSLKNNFFFCLFIFFSLLFSSSIAAKASTGRSNSKFTHTISKLFTEQELAHFARKAGHDVVWENPKTEPFSELIVSWNAMRPKAGSMTVWVSVKHRNQWTGWHRLAEWGANFQRTFVNKLSPFAHTKHCRVEMQKKALARGYRVKISFHHGAQVTNLKALYACLSQPNHLKIIRPANTLPSVVVKNVPRQSQMQLKHHRAKDLCAPTSCSMLVAYFYHKLYGMKPTASMHDFVIDFAARAHDQGFCDIYGNWILNVAQAFDSCNGDVFFRVERLNSFYDLHHYLTKKIPVAVSVRRLPDGATPYANGHYMVIVGYNQKTRRIVCIDPAYGRFPGDKPNLRTYPLANFLKAWSLSSNMAYIAAPKQTMA